MSYKKLLGMLGIEEEEEEDAESSESLNHIEDKYKEIFEEQ